MKNHENLDSLVRGKRTMSTPTKWLVAGGSRRKVVQRGQEHAKAELGNGKSMGKDGKMEF
jgi:hypothetical protein